uniref:Uncharacterized protein n=1 Tax=Vespula pensylvanica TaxID=30213 RepID=A0A834PBP2_VESPE|nr:hypothetical protein H0235_003570 [Vespula pensylvanica]
MLVFNGKNIQVSHSLLADWKPTIHEKLSEVENLLGRSFVMARESRQETYVGASKKVGDEKSIAVSSVGERKVRLFEKIIIDPAYMEKCGIVYSYSTLSREILTTKVIPTRNKHFHICTDSTCEDIFQKDNYISKIICEEFTITRVDIFGRLAGLLEDTVDRSDFQLGHIRHATAILFIILPLCSVASTSEDLRAPFDTAQIKPVHVLRFIITSREKLSKPSIGRVSGLERSLAEDEEGDASTEADRELKREVEVEVGANSNYERLGRMLTARSGPLGVPRSLGPLEGSDHLFLLPERALIMDSSRLRQDLAGLDFNLRFNILQTAPRGNVWLYLREGGKGEGNLTEFHFDKEALSYKIS